MLRITTQRSPQAVTLRLEGRLDGPWVELLADCWRSERAQSNGRRFWIDLNGVTFIDGDGKACLARMHEQGARFIADDLLNKALVAEIVGRLTT